MYISTDSNSLRYGAWLGFKLSRLEWMWDSPFEFAQKEFKLSKTEILSQLPLDKITIDESDYQSFTQSILNYYLRTDISLYSAVLIGISMQRCMLIEASEDPSKRHELQELAMSALRSIPKNIVPDRTYLWKLIVEHRDDDLFDILDVLEQLCRKPPDNPPNTTTNNITNNTVNISGGNHVVAVVDNSGHIEMMTANNFDSALFISEAEKAIAIIKESAEISEQQKSSLIEIITEAKEAIENNSEEGKEKSRTRFKDVICSMGNVTEKLLSALSALTTLVKFFGTVTP